VVLDESSSFKDHGSQRFKAVKLIRSKINRIIELTGTPAPNGLINLWAPMYLLDQGERLEKTITAYRERYFVAEKQEGYITYSYRLRKGCEEAIYNKIGDICMSMKSEDYLDLPPLIENDVYLTLDKDIQTQYDQFEEESIMEIIRRDEQGQVIYDNVTAMNAAALTTKLLQFSNGAIYHQDKTYSELHNVKLDALERIMDEAQGNSILVFYSYRHDLERILKRFKGARLLKSEDSINDWNLGKIQMAVAHPASCGHGLNLQSGGHIMVWYGLSWSSELYLQAIKRIHRQGQEQSVMMHRLIVKGTMDVDVVESLAKKISGQNALMQAIRARVEKYDRKAA
jgi:SNF2 family DNA or RNA helicase